MWLSVGVTQDYGTLEIANKMSSIPISEMGIGKFNPLQRYGIRLRYLFSITSLDIRDA
jgi:hypothetical protein